MGGRAVARRLIAVVAAVVSATACASERTSPPTSPIASSTAPSRTDGLPDLGAPEVVAQGIEVPWGLTFLADGAALVAERDSGRILRVVSGRPPEPFLEVPGVVARGEGGLLGLAVREDYVYAYFTSADDNRVVRFRPGGPVEVVFAGIAKAGNHNGGRIAFGPDGMLYVGTGDAGRPSLSQDPTSPNGKILRLTAEGAPAPGNPTPGSPVLSTGHRNVQGLAWDATGALYAAEFGQNRLDEINRIEPGRNYGWPDVEGGGGADRGFTDPLLTWSTEEASPSGIAIAGDTLYVAALRGERLWTAKLSGEVLVAPRDYLRDTYGRLRTVVVAPDGALWLTTSNTDGRGDLRDGDDRILRFPAR
ncbi:PQQ-dependent sugar dehydrogenase [Nocardia caishijiensis]|uniref:Glucose/arabinose dehydrogenase n=1 Tax=Nocardia caishijiensis TaxID=184756 RepID=A0ABQ6YHX9_9NOCA|nr:PQQ-dependent sugar dehydrogenase [Nocardia caishijiensis]KAF0845384.1 glucose/arabinose dehydrogenase [Nocardia caishijiensis]